MQNNLQVKFIPLKPDHLNLLYKWLNLDHVAKWYGKGRNYQFYRNVEDHYLPRTRDICSTKAFIIYIDQNSIGYIQTYKITDYPDYNKHIQADNNSAGMDLFIGDENYLHRGLGPEIIKKFLNEVVFKIFDVEKCIIGPELANKAAIKAYQKAGFSYWKTVKIPDEAEPEYLMILKN
ncbi:MAG: hypothetical protein APR63_05765 [Desulfuromonas sp. SDB]|nr:MAG: hypothetical protein APR63_05765 [Desulfuromonas sp. SDB]